MRSNIGATLVVLCISVYFFVLAGPGIYADFTFDDLSNLYFAWITPLPELFRANVLFFLPPTRPLGRLFYALGFKFAGLNPLPYHAVCFFFLAANVYLMYCFTKRLTGSRSVAVLAGLLHCYHGSSAGLSYNSGTCYDTLCFFFYIGALTYYVTIRQQGGVPRPWQIVLLACFYIASLNAKEIAVSLPVIIGLYEFLYHPKERWRSRGVTIAIMALITAAYIFGTTRGVDSLVVLEAYRPTFSATSYLVQMSSVLNDLTFSINWFTNSKSLVLLAALFFVARLCHDRHLTFCWLFLTIGILPIAFIPPRGLYAAYVPAFGLSVFLAVLLEKATSGIKRPSFRIGLFVLAAIMLASMHKIKGADNVFWITVSQKQIREVIVQLRQLHPTVSTGSRILFLRDPFDDRVWDSTFLLRLLYQDNSLTIDRGADGHDVSKYDYVWDFEKGKLLEVSRPHLMR